MRLNLFWKLGFAFFALLIAVLLPVDYYAERNLRRDYERAGFDQLSAIARIALASPPPVSSLSTNSRTPSPALREWVARMAASDVRVTVITADGLVLADSQSDPQTMENHAGRPEIREALAKGDGLSIRHSVTINRDLLYYATRFSILAGPPVILRFAIPLRTVDDEVWGFRRRLWLSSLAMLLVTGMASLLISRSFSRRVERLQSFSRRVAEGRPRHAAPDRSFGSAAKTGRRDRRACAGAAEGVRRSGRGLATRRCGCGEPAGRAGTTPARAAGTKALNDRALNDG